MTGSRVYEAMTTRILGNPDASTMLVQMVDDHDLALIESESREIADSCPGRDFSLLTVKVDAWNADLSDSGIRYTLEWNEGNHFRDSDMRMARGFAWLLNGK